MKRNIKKEKPGHSLAASFDSCFTKLGTAFYRAEHPVAVPELLTPDVLPEHVPEGHPELLDVDAVQPVHCVQAVAAQLVHVDVVLPAHPEHVVLFAAHPEHVVLPAHPEHVVLFAAHPEHVVLDDVVGAFAEHPCGTEVVVVVAIGVAVAVAVVVVVVVAVELDDICPTAVTTLKIESATAATTRQTAIFFMLTSFSGWPPTQRNTLP